jgi:hypothetical protein
MGIGSAADGGLACYFVWCCVYIYHVSLSILTGCLLVLNPVSSAISDISLSKNKGYQFLKVVFICRGRGYLQVQNMLEHLSSYCLNVNIYIDVTGDVLWIVREV